MSVSFSFTLALVSVIINLASCQRNGLHQPQEQFPGLLVDQNFRRHPSVFMREMKNLPVGDNKKLNGAVVFAPTNGYIPPPPNDAFLPVRDSQGRTHMVPKFVYFDSHTDSKLKANFKSPNLHDIPGTITNFLSGSGGYVKDVKSLGGIYVPMPYPLSPLAFQLIGSDKTDVDNKLGLGTRALQQEPANQNLDSKDLLMSNIRSLIGKLTNNNNGLPQQPIETRPIYNRRDSSPLADSSFGRYPQISTQADPANRLVHTLINLVTGKANQKQAKLENQAGSVGAASRSNVLTKAAGLYMSVPGLPPSYLGTNWNLVDADAKKFG